MVGQLERFRGVHLVVHVEMRPGPAHRNDGWSNQVTTGLPLASSAVMAAWPRCIPSAMVLSQSMTFCVSWSMGRLRTMLLVPQLTRDLMDEVRVAAFLVLGASTETPRPSRVRKCPRSWPSMLSMKRLLVATEVGAMSASAPLVRDRAPALPVDAQLASDTTEDLVGQVVQIHRRRVITGFGVR